MGPLPATNSAPTTDSAVKARTNSSASSAAAAAADDAVSHSSAAVNGARRAEHAEDPANGGALARGRKTTREASDDDAEGSGDDDKDGGAKGGARKRKRSRKGLDKKYMCQHPDCTKSYSRAEHLYRHQLNREFHLSHSSPWNCPQSHEATGQPQSQSLLDKPHHLESLTSPSPYIP